MPAKGKKGGKKKKKNEALTKKILSTIISYWRRYESHCNKTNTCPAPSLKAIMNKCKEDESYMTKFILEPKPVQTIEDPIVQLEPVMNALREERYTNIKALYVWSLTLRYIDAVAVGQVLDKMIYPIKHLEFIDNLMTSEQVGRISQSFENNLFLSTLVFDYNEFRDEGCKKLCDGLALSKTIISVSLCFCDLTSISGKYLARASAHSSVRELYLDGNLLQCHGVQDLIEPFVVQAKKEAFNREEEERKKKELEQEEIKKAEEERRRRLDDLNYVPPQPVADTVPVEEKEKKKKKKKKKSKQPPPPPLVGPWIHKLHIADNGIDGLEGQDKMAPVECMQQLRELISTSKCLEEIDLHDNLIGDLAGREICFGLEIRKEEKLPNMKLRTTHRLTADTFTLIKKLGAGLQKKKKKKRKSKK
ncbi:DgyrCDS10536 [Dimorphilus gyrociliatus]|uniref:DgyrCDS10536 n=1 Tax=Dimorphilus gyrociliatus TaxID=2664684 RepID=A0A7I8W2H6_9ANNE|nr:DgyrCDS10536 [Dimorphilus gyrociliatus]